MSPISFLPPHDVAQGQLDAYNARDIDTFMTFWDEGAQVFEHPATLLAEGAVQIRARHLVRFQEPDLYGELLSRVVLGNTVIDHERVRRNFAEGVGHLQVACIYEIGEGKIRRAWFISGEKTLGVD